MALDPFQSVHSRHRLPEIVIDPICHRMHGERDQISMASRRACSGFMPHDWINRERERNRSPARPAAGGSASRR
jgi:hypothetical protein